MHYIEDFNPNPFYFNSDNIYDDDFNQELDIAPPFASFEDENFSPFMVNIPKDLVLVEEEEENNSSFPFNKGEGIPKALEKIGIDCKYISETEVNLTRKNLNFKFKTANYDINKNGKKIKKKQRKKKPDLIRKKIKGRFHKDIKNIINKKLISAGSYKFFAYLPQTFITNITVKVNKEALDLTYEKLLETDFNSGKKKKKKFIVHPQEPDNYRINCEVLEYLKKSPEILKNSEFDRIKKMQYKDILKAYFDSKEFEDSLLDLKNNNQDIEYIQNYVNCSLTYIEYFSNRNVRSTNGIH